MPESMWFALSMTLMIVGLGVFCFLIFCGAALWERFGTKDSQVGFEHNTPMYTHTTTKTYKKPEEEKK